jgi:hypothetical protein
VPSEVALWLGSLNIRPTFVLAFDDRASMLRTAHHRTDMEAVPMTTQAIAPEPVQKTLDANLLRVVLDLSERLRTYEAEFGFPTSELEAALASGQVSESSKVADWLIGYRTLTAVIGSGSAPAE